jgi:OmpA-OmpF porin, OOP family
MQLRSALLAATVLATPIAASAQPVTGLYVGAGAGVNITQRTSIKSFSTPSLPIGPFTNTGDLNGSTGFAGVGSVGFGFGNGLRAEIEGNYRNNHSSGFSSGAVSGGVNGGTTEQKYGAMANVLFDFNGLTPWVTPYIGVGAGYIWINEKWKSYNTTGLPAAPPGSLFASGHSTQGSFAYQAILGAAIPLPTILPGLAFTAEYRFLGTAGDRTYKGTVTGPGVVVPGGVTPASVKLGPSYNHAVLLGLRYNFGVAPPPPPPPAPVPAQAPARSYLVFFDWDKATLTDRARQIIKEAADNSTRVQYTRIEVNGYTDTSGTPKYNQGLSVRRAQAVAAELVKNGVPRNVITIQGFGETHLLVPTGPGVREPQNRRVEIIIR